MKNFTILFIISFGAIILISACNSNQSTGETLKDNSKRKEIVSAMVHHPPYRMEVMHEMMNNDSCRLLLGQNMLKDPHMMSVMMGDSFMMHHFMNGNRGMQNMMMGQMVDMAENDSVMCDEMLHIMKQKPNMRRRMMHMNRSNSMMK